MKRPGNTQPENSQPESKSTRDLRALLARYENDQPMKPEDAREVLMITQAIDAILPEEQDDPTERALLRRLAEIAQRHIGDLEVPRFVGVVSVEDAAGEDGAPAWWEGLDRRIGEELERHKAGIQQSWASVVADLPRYESGELPLSAPEARAMLAAIKSSRSVVGEPELREQTPDFEAIATRYEAVIARVLSEAGSDGMGPATEPREPSYDRVLQAIQNVSAHLEVLSLDDARWLVTNIDLALALGMSAADIGAEPMDAIKDIHALAKARLGVER